MAYGNQQVVDFATALVPMSDQQLARDGLAAAVSMGLIKHVRDQVGLGRLMQVSPTTFPRGPIDEAQIGDWLREMREQGRQFQGVDMTPARLQEQPRLPIQACNVVLMGLAYEVSPANAARQADTATITLKTALEDVTLWIDTANGLVDQITAITVDDDDYNLGPSDKLSTLVCDLATEPHPVRAGIRIPYIEEELVIAVSIQPSAEDVAWQVIAEGTPVRKAKGANHVYPLRGRSYQGGY